MNSRALAGEKLRPSSRMSHKSKAYKNQTRSDVLEAGLSGQERTIAVLLEQAFRIKEEVAAGLQSTRGSIQVEALSRKLLENHILTITRIVKQLSLDIQALEKQIKERDLTTSGTTLAFQELDQRNMAGFGNLRGRVARCDASIAKLSAGVISGEQQLIRLQQEVTELRSAVDGCLKELKVKIYHDLGRLEASASERYQGQKCTTSDLQAQVKQLDDRISVGLKEAKEQRDSLRKWTEQRLSTSTERCTQQLNKMIESVSILADRLCALEARMKQCETQQEQTHRRLVDLLKRHETKLTKSITSVESDLHQELQLLKQESHKGFLSVHDAVESLRQIGDIKSQLNKKELQRDFRLNNSKVTDLHGL
ncbi:protein FAM81B [Cheilinus undulatus]|uniref:protein FAM81B n=1 Tax=Cheilinus undulatus TaxID=241271 RepID=UPI001BD25783|nr:protein FAM81B [Cheilinus undulatus]